MGSIEPSWNSNFEQQCYLLANKLLAKCVTRMESAQRVIVGIAGIPGAGKSTVSALVSRFINEIFEAHDSKGKHRSTIVVAVPMDGFHLTRAQLNQLPDPQRAIHRRGAAFTYDAEAYFEFVRRLKTPMVEDNNGATAPSFDHAIKDPVPDDIHISSDTRIVLIEGNYCALNRAPWSNAAELMDELWLVSVDKSVARERLARRHVLSGVTPDLKSAYERIESTDFLNADDILSNMLSVQEVIHVD